VPRVIAYQGSVSVKRGRQISLSKRTHFSAPIGHGCKKTVADIAAHHEVRPNQVTRVRYGALLDARVGISSGTVRR